MFKYKILSATDFILVSFVVFFITVLAIIQIYLVQEGGIPFLFGDQKEAIFDWWSLEHLLVGFIIGSFFIKTKFLFTKNIKKFVLIILILAFGWEIFEIMMEYGKVDLTIAQWKNGHEHWLNRFLRDPVMNTLGSLLAYKIKDKYKS